MACDATRNSRGVKDRFGFLPGPHPSVTFCRESTRADFHVRHGAGVRQFIEVAQKLPEKCQQTAMEVR